MDNPEKKPKLSTARRAVACTGALLLAGACAGGPSLTRPPEDMACPAGSQEAMENVFGLDITGIGAVIGLEYSKVPVAVRHGETVTITNMQSKKGLPKGTRLTAKVTLGAYKGEPAAYFRITQAVTPDGTKGPVCLCAYELLDSEGKVDPYLNFHWAERFFHNCGGTGEY